MKDLLDGIGIHSEIASFVVAALGLIGVIYGGVTALVKLTGTARARLKARQGDGQRRLRKRSAFAGFVERKVRDLDNKEEWSDERFAELEAEIETAGLSRSHSLSRARRGLRRERSLSKALRKSDEQLVLLQGDPGSGKSVALRYVAVQMASAARKSKRLDAVIPLYVNLKGLHARGRAIDAQLIEDFVLDSLRDGATADVDRFLEAEFESGKVDGSWFFLFDSFDEIPELLSSTDVDSAVQAYSDAISNFVHGISECRGVIASRHFRAPPSYGLPTFTIVPLSEKRRRKLIDKADLEAPETELLDSLPAANPELLALSQNPLFLGLLVEYVRKTQTLPTGWYDVFEAFVSRRIDSHLDKLRHDYGIEPADLRQRSEEIAFTMTATEGLGLSPRRSELRSAYEKAGFAGVGELDAVMDALQWTKLARTEESNTSGIDPTFTFAHRRFQEYFATRVVLREPARVPPEMLLTDAGWRETAVTLCQAQPESSGPLIAYAQRLLGASATADGNEQDGDFAWQPGVLHVLGLLQSAYAGNTDSLPVELRESISSLLLSASKRGTIADRKWALEVAGTLPAEKMASLLLSGFKGGSDWLREVAYRQAARLPVIPDEIAIEIRRALVGLAARGQLQSEWRTTKAQVMRLRPASAFLASARVLRLAPLVDAIVCALGVLALIAILEPGPDQCLGLLVGGFALHASYYVTAAVIARRASLRTRSVGVIALASSMIGIIAIEVRALAVPFPLALAVAFGDEMAIAGGLAWAFALSWSVAATALTVRRPPRSLIAWILAPLRFVPWLVASVRKLGLSSLATGLAMVVAMVVILGLFFYGLSRLPDSTQSLIFIPMTAVGALFFVVLLVRATWIELRDWHWMRRWSKRHGPRISSAEFLESLSSIPGGGGVSTFVAEVRIERLLREDDEAEAMVRDLLHAARPPLPTNGDGQPAASPSWRSDAYASWAKENGHVARKLSHPGVEDLLGQLLEDLERKEEIPVA
ncbi:MAG TPA: NACHT domain-containing protein [Solirubrobacterales bacterium]|nr:NACHT domain-containing protein [Solirubrobacterales bacterium]